LTRNAPTQKRLLSWPSRERYYFASILEQVEDAEREAAGEFTAPKGDLVITAPILFGRLHVLPVVADFLALFPEINIRLVMADRNIDLVDAHIDMAVRIGKLPDSSMVATQIGLMRTVVCASPSLTGRRGVPQTPDDLLKLPCVTFDTPLPSPGWRFKAPGSMATFELPVVPRLSVTTAEAAAQAAIRSIGATRLLHYQVAEAVEADALRIILAEFEPDAAPVNLVHASRGQMPLKMRRFWDFATPRLHDMIVKVAACVGQPQRLSSSDNGRSARRMGEAYEKRELSCMVILQRVKLRCQSQPDSKIRSPLLASVGSAQRPGPVAVAAVFPEFIAREQPGQREAGRQGRSAGSGAARSAARTRPCAP
jgi:DNA-binding transcriptional LysR family regulator